MKRSLNILSRNNGEFHVPIYRRDLTEKELRNWEDKGKELLDSENEKFDNWSLVAFFFLFFFTEHNNG